MKLDELKKGDIEAFADRLLQNERLLSSYMSVYETRVFPEMIKNIFECARTNQQAEMWIINAIKKLKEKGGTNLIDFSLFIDNPDVEKELEKFRFIHGLPSEVRTGVPSPSIIPLSLRRVEIEDGRVEFLERLKGGGVIEKKDEYFVLTEKGKMYIKEYFNSWLDPAIKILEVGNVEKEEGEERFCWNIIFGNPTINFHAKKGGLNGIPKIVLSEEELGALKYALMRATGG